MNNRKISLCGDWKLAVAQHGEHSEYTSALQIKEEVIPAKVPGNHELDLFAAGKVEDLFFGNNPDKIRRFTERMHCYYFRNFNVDKIETTPILRFDGLDCYADVFINGIKVGSYDNFSGAQTIALKFNGCPTAGAGKLTITDQAFPAIRAGENLPLTYFAKVSGDAKNTEGVEAAKVVFTISIVE